MVKLLELKIIKNVLSCNEMLRVTCASNCLNDDDENNKIMK